MFIVSVESSKAEPSKQAIEIALERHFGRNNGVAFKVEEGGHKEVANLVSSYLSAEEALERFESFKGVSLQNVIDLNTKDGQDWKTLYDAVRMNRTVLVSKLREYGASV